MKKVFLISLFCIISQNLFSQEKYSSDYDSLVRLAKIEKKVVVLFFGADWCSPCNKLFLEANINKENNFFLKSFSYYYFVNVDQYENLELVTRFNVSLFPSIVIYNPVSRNFILKRGSLPLKFIDETVEKVLKSQNTKYAQ